MSAAAGRKPWAVFLGLGAGALLGLLGRAALGPAALERLVGVAQPLGQLFLRLVFMAVVPLVPSALALGVAELGSAGKIGRVGAKTLFFTLLFSGAAVLTGVGLTNWVRPGEGLPEQARARLQEAFSGDPALGRALENARKAQGPAQVLLDLIPKNPVAAAAGAFEGGLLPLMVFSLLLGAALCHLPEASAGPLKNLLSSVQAAMLKLIDFAMRLAPLGVGSLVFSMAATVGLEALGLLGRYVGLVLAALLLHSVLVYGAALKLAARRDPWLFLKGSAPVLLSAFATSSSSATLPLTLKAAREELGIPRAVGDFVLTVGATANQNGTALYEGVTVLFLAQFFGVELSLSQQLWVVFWSVLAGVGTAGVPGGSLPMIVVLLESLGVPGGAVGMILGVDRFLDMSRTAVNVAGDLAIAACVGAWEGPAGAGSYSEPSKALIESPSR